MPILTDLLISCKESSSLILIVDTPNSPSGTVLLSSCLAHHIKNAGKKIVKL